MAEKEEKESTPWIDYEGEAYKDEPAIRWTHTDLVNYWRHLQKIPVKWGIKETTLLSKLMKLYSAADLGDMMQLFVENNAGRFYNFSRFYVESEKTYEKVKKEREGWYWDK